MSRLATLIDTLRDRATPALHDDAGAMTGVALHAEVRRAASAISPGDRVVVLAPPTRAWVATVLGVMRAGGVAVPLSPLHPDAEIAALTDTADPALVVLDPSLASRRAAFGDRVVVAPLDLAGPRASGDVEGDAFALMLFTSGTTGKPKGALLSHDNLSTQIDLLGRAWEISPRDRLLHALPLHHMHGVAIALFNALLNGAEVELLPRFDKIAVWEGLARSTMFMSVPTMLHRLVEAFDGADDATRARWAASARALRLTTSGSAALPVGLADRWRELSGDIPLERFGMTEIGVGSTNPLRGERRRGTVGKELPTVETRIVDERGDDAVEGELWVRGPSVFRAYFRRDEATRDAFVGDWFRTGDVAVRDPHGNLRLLGRASVDILKSGGYKLSALEIEEALRELAGVAEVAVVGVPDERWGERVVAAVVWSGEPLDEARVRERLKARLAPYKVPQQVVAMPELPRNAMGKVVKPELVKLLVRGAS